MINRDDPVSTGKHLGALLKIVESLPVNKRTWSSSTVLLVIGLVVFGVLVIAALSALFDFNEMEGLRTLGSQRHVFQW